MIIIWALVAFASYYFAGRDGLILFGCLFVSLLFWAAAVDLRERRL